ncbi:MAG: DUF2799 domain-containing protein [Pseudomonadales bacterium]
MSMPSLLLRLTALASLLIASGCANRSLSEHQCLAGDWRTVGYSDGAAGHAQTRVLTHQNACGRHNVIPDTAAYRDGWNEGIAQFCTPQRGYDRGLAGHSLPMVCPSASRQSYRAAYDTGRELFLARDAVRSLEQQLGSHEHRIDQLGDELIDSTTAQIDPLLTPKERIELVTLSKRLIEERERLHQELPELRRALDDAIIHLESVEQRFAARG